MWKAACSISALPTVMFPDGGFPSPMRRGWLPAAPIRRRAGAVLATGGHPRQAGWGIDTKGLSRRPSPTSNSSCARSRRLAASMPWEEIAAVEGVDLFVRSGRNDLSASLGHFGRSGSSERCVPRSTRIVKAAKAKGQVPRHRGRPRERDAKALFAAGFRHGGERIGTWRCCREAAGRRT